MNLLRQLIDLLYTWKEPIWMTRFFLNWLCHIEQQFTTSQAQRTHLNSSMYRNNSTLNILKLNQPNFAFSAMQLQMNAFPNCLTGSHTNVVSRFSSRTVLNPECSLNSSFHEINLQFHIWFLEGKQLKFMSLYFSIYFLSVSEWNLFKFLL